MPLAPEPGSSPVVAPPATVSVNARIPGVQGALKWNPSDPRNYINQKVDARLSSIIKKTGSPLVTGIIQQTDDAVAGDQKFPYACRFLFNPGQITVNYGTANDVLPPGMLSPDQLKGTAVYAGQTGITFSLLFDRTYEVAYKPQRGMKDLRSVGVYEDIAALESITGARLNFTRDISGQDASGNPTTLQNGPGISNMYMVPAYFIFGGGDGSGDVVAKKGLSYIGFITQMTVSYALFSENMIPTRCGVDITVQQLIGRDFSDFVTKGGTLIDRSRSRSTTSSGAAKATR